MSKTVIDIKNLVKYLGSGEFQFQVIKELNFSINQNDFVIMVGPSGSGKTTLLNILCALEKADKGSVFYDDKDINRLSESQRIQFRRGNIGYIFQDYLLLSNLTATENIGVGASDKQQLKNIPNLLDKVGLSEHEHKLPSELSGGQQQRVSILRALLKKPKVLICDEPTGALDQESSKDVLELIQEFHSESDMTVVIVTHDNKIPDIGNRVIHLKDGKIESIIEQEPKKVKEIDW
ncbi:ABC transporter ATP-binding protein [Lentibacillus salicampi]|uniref:ABC transporter ATP-binding protein n=1 Tax=Lentibacillus salicampi TaxID=175306 RepID=A0A4Y9AC68_9BACI|nr:ABC transporter ATP-binding protein [Lentibacillus salicampi]TFJ91961.1 ABC transporter ATP-binding protein [Lentibacillus salicampi]